MSHRDFTGQLRRLQERLEGEHLSPEGEARLPEVDVAPFPGSFEHSY